MVLQQNNPGLDLSRFRSILAVYNFDLNAGQSGEDVVYGLTPGVLSWAQGKWSPCATCSGLFRSDAAASICAGSVGSTPFAHTKNGDEVQVPTVSTLLSGLGGFSTCRRCGVLYELARASGCPAGGAHADDASRFYLLSNWKSGFASSGWQRCQDCGMVLQPGPQFLCPGTRAAHVTLSETFSFSAVALASPSLTWMCHEMGQAYGFIHGRSTQPDSTDLYDDASPGAYGDPYDIMSAPALRVVHRRPGLPGRTGARDASTPADDGSAYPGIRPVEGLRLDTHQNTRLGWIWTNPGEDGQFCGGASYEVGRRRVPVSLLPQIASTLAVSLEELIGKRDAQPAKRGPAPKLQ